MSTLHKTEPPNKVNAYHAGHARLLVESFLRVTGQNLVPTETAEDALGIALYNAERVIVSHGIEQDPIFNYANKQALSLFEMHWHEFTALPSRLSAEAMHREERAKLMQTVTTQGYIDDYAGVRISKSGKRFMIEHATVWNIIDTDGGYRGQAATFDQWRFLD